MYFMVLQGKAGGGLVPQLGRESKLRARQECIAMNCRLATSTM